MHRPRKRFGQHFLHDPQIIQRIVNAIHPEADDHIVEIGPGQGALTLALLQTLSAIDVVEIDRDLVDYLTRLNIDKLHIHQCDALKFDFCSLQQDNKLRIVGNLPYNISTPLLFHLIRFRHCIQDMFFMLQKEVIDRIVAKPGNKTYGRLSVMMQYYCEVEDLFSIAPGAFRPPPKVWSSIVRLIPHAQAPFTLNGPEQQFSQIVQQAFSQRRKTLRNSLKQWLSEEEITAAGIDPTLRPEQLELDAFVRLANAVKA
jgi:16S rRNA (adenine1518-N6/adenine1519-N6)-dimethyltransferase